jgi:hypothetical protein
MMNKSIFGVLALLLMSAVLPAASMAADCVTSGCCPLMGGQHDAGQDPMMQLASAMDCCSLESAPASAPVDRPAGLEPAQEGSKPILPQALDQAPADSKAVAPRASGAAQNRPPLFTLHASLLL